MWRARETHIAVEVSDWKVFIPHTPKDIALYRVNVQQRFVRVLEEVRNTACAMSCSDNVVESISQALIAAVNHQQLCVSATYEELATCVLYITAVRTKIQPGGPGLLNELCSGSGFQTSVDKVEPLIPDVIKLLVDLDARAAIASFVQHCERKYPKLWRQREKFSSLTQQLWFRVQKYQIFPTEFALQCWLRVVASCLWAVTDANDIAIPVEQICAALGTSQYGNYGRDADQKVSALTEDDMRFVFLHEKMMSRRERKVKARVAQIVRARQAGPMPSFAEIVLDPKTAVSMPHQMTCRFANIDFRNYPVDTRADFEDRADVKRSRGTS
jgi:hypothetical protein